MEETQVRQLHEGILGAWNHRNAAEMAGFFTHDATLIGFDGSRTNSRREIETEISKVFADHPTGRYVWKTRSVRFLTPEIALLVADAGMVSTGQADINPAVNAVQCLVAQKIGGTWHAALLQNTPAQFHGRPDLAASMTEELRQVLRGEPGSAPDGETGLG